MPAPPPNYDKVASFYDAAAQLYSFGQIRRAKLAGLKFIAPGERVLFLGAGAGEEAARAAMAGAKVACIDLSRKMIERLRARLDRHGASAELIVGDALAHDRFHHYDAVAGNFFFNVFDAKRMPVFLEHAAQLVRPGGKLIIADVAPPTGGLPARLFNRFYARLGMAPFRLAGLVAWHATYDYARHFPRLGLAAEAVEDFRILRYGPVMFRAIVARKA